MWSQMHLAYEIPSLKVGSQTDWTIMSDEGEKACPLCTEEMDLTDQQLKPCKCGYEICVWCWNHIVGMAEKDGTAGRCPGCRTPYDKEKIVGMAAKCESLAAEISLGRKQKAQKEKPKASQRKKHLSSVRVIQRNLVHVNGLPLTVADEELLRHCEHFGQYGKVLKVSISRAASGAIHHSSNDSFSVYITYSKEEEAIRCIQAVHNYILEGRSLRACFGTTKYCNSWLKNVPCSIPHCLYLHDFGSPVDSFSKDEIASVFTRITVQQTGAMKHRSGNVLPPPVDDYNNFTISSASKPAVKGSSNISKNQAKGSVLDATTGKSIGPTMTWVPSVPTCSPSVPNSSGLTGPGNSKLDTSEGPLVLPSAVVSPKKFELDVANISTVAEASSDLDGKLDPSKATLHYFDRNSTATVSKKNVEVTADATPIVVTSSNLPPGLVPSREHDGNIAVASTLAISVELTRQSHSSDWDVNENLDISRNLQSLSESSPISLPSYLEDGKSRVVVPSSPISYHPSMNPPRYRCLQEDNSMQHSEPMTSSVLKETAAMVNTECVRKEGSLDFDNQGPQRSEGICDQLSMSLSSSLLRLLNQSSCQPSQPDENCNGNNINGGPIHVPVKPDGAAFPFASDDSVSNNHYIDDKVNNLTDSDRISECPDVKKGADLGRINCAVANNNNPNADEMGESILADILSLDMGAWDDQLTSSQSFATLLAETDVRHGSCELPTWGKVQNSNQSRFLFARLEDSPNQTPFEHSFDNIGPSPGNWSFPQGYFEDKDFPMGNYQNILPSKSSVDSEYASHCYPVTSSKELPVSRPRISAPPGFSPPSRAAPPGFSSHERVDPAVHNFPSSSPAIHLLQTPNIPFPPIGNVSSPVEFELNDPAIIEVGKGILIHPGFEHEATFQLQHFMQPNVPLHHHPNMVNNCGNRFFPQADVYSIPPMLPFPQFQGQQFINTQSNGQWGSWNEINRGFGI